MPEMKVVSAAVALSVPAPSAMPACAAEFPFFKNWVESVPPLRRRSSPLPYELLPK